MSFFSLSAMWLEGLFHKISQNFLTGRATLGLIIASPLGQCQEKILFEVVVLINCEFLVFMGFSLEGGGALCYNLFRFVLGNQK